MSTANSSFSSSSSPSSEKLERQEHTNNRRIRPSEANDESKSDGWRVIGAEIEIGNEIDTFSEVGYLYDGLKNRLTSEEVKKDRRREKAQKKLKLERSKNVENEEVEMIAGRSEEEETQEEIGEQDSEFIDVTSQDDEMMEVTEDERTDEEKMMVDRLLATIDKNSMFAENALLAMRMSPSPLPAPQNFSPFLQNSMMQRPLLSLFQPVVAPIQRNPMDLSANSPNTAPMEEEEDGEMLEENSYVDNGGQMFDFGDDFGDEEEYNGDAQMAAHDEEEQDEENFDEVATGSQGADKIAELFAGHPIGLKSIKRAANYTFLHGTNGFKTVNKYKRFVIKNSDSLKEAEPTLEQMYKKYSAQKKKEKERRREVRDQARAFNNRPGRLLFRPF